MEKTIILKNEEETKNFGIDIAKKLKPNTVIALIGDLGCGKTSLTKAIAKGLNITSNVTSPTFTIVQEYEEGTMPLYHFDVYRINDEDELFEIGFTEYFHKKGVCLIEWADLVLDLLPEDTIYIYLSYGENENERICTIKCNCLP